MPDYPPDQFQVAEGAWGEPLSGNLYVDQGGNIFDPLSGDSVILVFGSKDGPTALLETELIAVEGRRHYEVDTAVIVDTLGDGVLFTATMIQYDAKLNIVESGPILGSPLEFTATNQWREVGDRIGTAEGARFIRFTFGWSDFYASPSTPNLRIGVDRWIFKRVAPSFAAWIMNGQIATGGVAETVIFDETTLPYRGHNPIHAYDEETGIYTVPETGFWHFGTHLGMEGFEDSDDGFLLRIKRGSEVKSETRCAFTPSLTQAVGQLSHGGYYEVGDEVSVEVSPTTEGDEHPILGDELTRFWGFKIE